jgi:hypothetical protein
MCLSTLPFHFAFALGNLADRLNAARWDIVDPGARLGYGEENRVPGFLFERRFGFGLSAGYAAAQICDPVAITIVR